MSSTILDQPIELRVKKLNVFKYQAPCSLSSRFSPTTAIHHHIVQKSLETLWTPYTSNKARQVGIARIVHLLWIQESSLKKPSRIRGHSPTYSTSTKRGPDNLSRIQDKESFTHSFFPLGGPISTPTAHDSPPTAITIFT